MHVLGADHHARVRLELPVRGERHPESTEIVWLWDDAVRHVGTLHNVNSACHFTALRLSDWTGILRPGLISNRIFMKYHFYRLVKYLRMQVRRKLQARIKGKWQTEW